MPACAGFSGDYRRLNDGNEKTREGKGQEQSQIQAGGEKGGEAEVEETGQGRGGERPAAPKHQAVGRRRQGARRRAHPRFHARAVGADLHAAARLYGRRRDQGRAARRRRHHARPAARCQRGRQPLFHYAQRQQARDQQRLAHGPLTEYSQYGEGIPFGSAVPRAGNDSGGGQPGWILKCKGWESDPNAYIYFITQAPVWEAICDLIGEPDWKTDPEYATPRARLPRLGRIFDTIEQWTMTKDKFEVMEICNQHDIPVGPILSMKEIAEEKSLRDTGTVVEVDHPNRGKYLTVGNPVKMSDSLTEVKRAPLLGEHTEEILKLLGYSARDLDDIKASGAITAPEKGRAEAA